MRTTDAPDDKDVRQDILDALDRIEASIDRLLAATAHLAPSEQRGYGDYDDFDISNITIIKRDTDQ